MNLTHNTFATSVALQEAFEVLLQHLFSAPTDQPRLVVLPGGRTPLPVYQRMIDQPPVCSPGLHLCMSDERLVPADDPAYNAGYVAPLVQAMQLPPSHFLEVDTSLPLDAAADAFNQKLVQLFGTDLQVDTIFLGIGPDGHTASLFTLENAALRSARLAIPAERPEPPHRISLTPHVFQMAKRVIILAAGSDKQEIIDVLLHKPETIPCGIALQDCANVELWSTLS